MRTSVFVGLTIDGFLSRPDGSLDYLDPFVEDHGYLEFFGSVDCLVVGRATYDFVESFPQWPWTGKRVVVLTHRPLSAKHGETTHAGALAPLFAQLQASGVKHVYLDGGVAIRQGLAEGLVDELTLSTVPVMIGHGRPMFGGDVKHAGWKLVAHRTFASGITQSKYVRL